MSTSAIPSTKKQSFVDLGKKLKGASSLTLPLLSFAGTMLMATQALAIDANTTPTGENVIGGSVSFDRPADNVLNINQYTDRALIEWQSFNIGENATTQFYQPSSSSIAVNRVVAAGSDPTQILGTLKANGQVVVLDRNGVFFGPNSRVDVAGIIASTGDISNNDVFDESLNLNDLRDRIKDIQPGTIENKGMITVADGGLASFVAPTVVNSGIITAKLGKVELAGVEATTVDMYGDGLVEFEVTPAAAKAVVENSGVIDAEGGVIAMTTGGASAVIDSVINMSGTATAKSVSIEGGKIVLGGKVTAKDNGAAVKVVAKGKTTFTGEIETGTNANVEVSGDELELGGNFIAGEGTYINFDPASLTVGAAEATTFVNALNNNGVTVDVTAKNTITVNAAINSSAQTTNSTLNFKDQDANNSLTVNLNKKIKLGANQNLTGDATVVNVGANAYIQNGLDISASGASVTVANGTYNENLTISKAVHLRSENGRDATTINGISGVGALGTIVIKPNVNDVTIGGNADAGHGFTINGIDNGNPAIENAAVYLQGNHNNVALKANHITAAGDSAIDTEYSATVSNFTIDNNIIDGVTYETALPVGVGSSQQFTTAGVPRPAVYIGGGNKTNITFTNNTVDVTTGGLNASNQPQGNIMVNIDAAGATITGNTFAGTTAGYNGIQLRARGAATDIHGNIFDGTNIGAGGGYLIVKPSVFTGASGGAPTTIGELVAQNTFNGNHVYSTAYADPNEMVVGKTIQGGIDAAAVNATVYVSEGTYNESVNVNKTLTLLGANAGKAGTDATRGSESIIQSAGTIDAGWGDSYAVRATVENTVVDGFTILGDATDGGAAVLLNSASHAKIQNNILGNAGFGVVAYGTYVADGKVQNNLIHQLTGPYGYGAYISQNQYVDMLNNTIEDANVGIAQEWFYQASKNGAAGRIDGNTITASKIGIRNNLSYGTQSGYIISNNTITAADTAETRRWTGIDVVSQQAGVATQFINNTIDGSAVNATRETSGFELTNLTNTNRAVIDGGSISNVDVGVWATDGSFYTGAVNDLLVKNVAFSDVDEAAILVEDVEDALSQTGVNATGTTITIGAGNTFTNTPYDVVIAGDNANVNLDAGFDGVSKTLVKAAGNAHYTGNPWNTTTTLTTNNASINKGIGATAAGGEVDVEAGTFIENVVVNKSLTLKGDAAVDATHISGTGIGGNGIAVTADNVSLDNLVLENFVYGVTVGGTLVNDLSMDNVYAHNNTVGFKVGTATTIDGLTIANSRFNDNTFGWYFAKDNGTFPNASTVTDVHVTDTDFNGNLQKGIYAEKLDHADFTNVDVIGSGVDAGYKYNAGIDINLKNGTYADIMFDNLTVSGSGVNGTGRGTAVTVKARNDGATYGAYPASLSNLTIKNSSVVAGGDVAVAVGNNVDGAHIVNNTNITGPEAVLFFEGVKNAEAKGNTIHSTGLSGISAAYGIAFDHTVGGNASGNTITGTNAGAGVQALASGNITVGGANIADANTVSSFKTGVSIVGSTGDTLIQNNEVSGSTDTSGGRVASDYTTGIGIFVDNTSGNVTVAGNNAHNNTDGIRIRNTDSATVSGNTLANNTDKGMIAKFSDALQIVENTITGNDIGVYLDGSVGGLLKANTISSNTHDGIHLRASTGAVQIENNFIWGNANGVNAETAANVTVFDNSFADENGSQGNTIDVRNTTAGTVNASNNWWGTTDAAAIAAKMGGSVDFSPYMGEGTDTSPLKGFQGNMGNLMVTNLGAQQTGIIQEAVEAATENGNITLNGGTYIENVNLDKAGLKMTGNGATVQYDTANAGINGTTVGSIFTVTADGVNIDPFIFDGGAVGVTVLADNVVVDGNEFKNQTQYAIYMLGADNASIVNNNIHDIGQYGIFADTSNNATIQGNTVNNANVGVLVVKSDDAKIGGAGVGEGNTITNVADGIAIRADGVTANNGVVEGNIINGTTRTGMYMANTTNLDVKNNQIDNSGRYSSIYINGGSSADVTGNTLNHSDETGIYFENVGGTNTASGNTIDNTGETKYASDGLNSGDAIRATGTLGLTVADNIIGTNGAAGSIRDMGVHLLGGTNGAFVQGNTVKNTTASGIGVESSNDITIGGAGLLGNTVSYTTGSGIRAEAGNNLTIDDNDISNSAGAGIYALNITNSTLSNNTISNVDKRGIGVSGGNGVSVSGNKVDNTGLDGIGGLNNVVGLSITGNFVGTLAGANNITGNGIYVENTGNAIVTGNTVRNAHLSGIYGNNADGANISANNVAGTGDHGIFILNADNATVGSAGNANIISTTGKAGVRVENGTGSSVDSNDISNTTGAGIYAQNTTNNTISNNTVSGTTLRGISANGGTGLGITDNTVDNTTLDGIYAQNVGNLDVTGNKVGTNGGANNIAANGILVTGSAGANIDTNKVAKTAGRGIMVDGAVASVNGNIVFKTGDDAIEVSNAANVQVQNNKVGTDAADVSQGANNVGGEGIDVNGSAGAQISGNRIRETVGNGIAADLSANVNIDTNNIADGDASAVNVSGSDGAQVTNNTIADSKRGVLAGTSDDINIYNNDIQNIDGNGIEVIGGLSADVILNHLNGILNAIGIKVDGNDNVAISDNTVEDISGISNTKAGIDINNSDNAIVGTNLGKALGFNTVSTGAEAGIRVSNSDNTMVVDNNVNDANNADDATDYGVAIINGTNSTVIGNSVNDRKVGVLAEGSDNISISNHTMNTGNEIGIQLNNTNNSTIQNNTIDNASVAGIDVTGTSSSNTVDNNILTGNAIGIRTSGGTVGSVKLTDNFLTGNTTGIRLESGLVDMSDTVNYNIVNGGNVGLQMERVGADGTLLLVGNTLGATRFNGQNDFYIRLENNAYYEGGTSFVIDAQNVYFDGFSPSLSPFGYGILTLQQLTDLESKIFDLDDQVGRGQVFVGYVPGLNQEDLFPNGLGTFGGPAGNFSVTILGLPNVPGGTQNLGALLNNLTPFAGGNSPQDLASINPAAGGGNDLNNIEPASGGNNIACWNDLGNGVSAGAVNYNFTSGNTAADMEAAAACGG